MPEHEFLRIGILRRYMYTVTVTDVPQPQPDIKTLHTYMLNFRSRHLLAFIILYHQFIIFYFNLP